MVAVIGLALFSSPATIGVTLAAIVINALASVLGNQVGKWLANLLFGPPRENEIPVVPVFDEPDDDGLGYIRTGKHSSIPSVDTFSCSSMNNFILQTNLGHNMCCGYQFYLQDFASLAMKTKLPSRTCILLKGTLEEHTRTSASAPNAITITMIRI